MGVEEGRLTILVMHFLHLVHELATLANKQVGVTFPPESCRSQFRPWESSQWVKVEAVNNEADLVEHEAHRAPEDKKERQHVCTRLHSVCTG